MAKKVKDKLMTCVGELEVGSVFRIPQEFNADHATVVAVKDANGDVAVGAAAIKGKLSLVTLTAAAGPYKGSTATVLMNTCDEVEVVKKAKSDSWWRAYGVAALIPTFFFGLMWFNEPVFKMLGVLV